MCLLTRQIKPIITKKDMIVVKRLTVENDKYYSHYFKPKENKWNTFTVTGFEYIPEVLNKTELGVSIRSSKGVCSFGDADTRVYKETRNYKKLTIIEQGFHFMIRDSESYDELDNCDRFDFLIPKGSTIYLGKTGCGVSNQIIMLKP